MKNKKSIILLSILVLVFVSIAVGVTYAFFNYTRTGEENSIRVGRIYFHTNQDRTISLTNIFPVSSNSVLSNANNTVTVSIEGDTTYSGGIEYLVTIEDVNNIVNGKEVPISFKATQSNLGTSSNTYWESRGENTPIYELTGEGVASEGKYVMVGYIPAGAQGIDGSVSITAYLNTTEVAITDTVENGNIVVPGYDNGTNDDWIAGREVITEDEWNSFATTPLSFKVRVEANEGIWVEKEKYLTIKNFANDENWINLKANITSIEFHKDGLAPANYVTSFDVTDDTSDSSKGSITLYTVDDGLGTNTYKAIIVGNDIIYAPAIANGMFRDMSELITFNSKNFKVDNVTNMSTMFYGCLNLTDISSLYQWNTTKVETMSSMFAACTSLNNLNGLSSWNTLNVSNMSYMFQNASSITNLNSIANWDVSNVTSMRQMFYALINLEDASGINGWNISPNCNFSAFFYNTPVHPEFTQVQGTWSSSGKFTPST